MPTGAVLPSEATLCRRYAASRNTVRQAIAVLVKDGWIKARRGGRRFVSLVEDEP
ncbi:GntR family transcriptional regulator [Nonomuraea africana]|uniref:GntR family transcriptional regulator n=1 Tax=Nonomuraea africana TaxID=46171 RepID=UPI001CEF3472